MAAALAAPLDGHADGAQERAPTEHGAFGRALLIWNAACLDAPCVVVLWSLALARTLGAIVAPAELVLLFAGVWMGYCADRLADGWRLPHALARTARHRFAIRHRRRLVTILAVLFPASLVAGLLVLPDAVLFPGCAIAAAAALHTWSVQRWPDAARRWLPRELVVGGLLAVAALAFAGLGGERLGGQVVGCALGVAALFTLDCWVVSSGEVDADRARGEASLAQLPGVGLGVLFAACAVLASTAGLAAAAGHPLGLSFAAGAAGLLWIAADEPGGDLRPALADLVLCAAAGLGLALAP